MREINALIVSTNQDLVTQLSAILNEYGIKPDFKEEWQASSRGLDSYTYAFVDAQQLKQSTIQDFSLSRYVIVFDRQASVDSVRIWLKSGAHDVVLLPEEGSRVNELLQNSISMVQNNEAIPQMSDQQDNKIFSFFSSKGGSGKSLISTLFAQSLQLYNNKRGILIDLNTQYGGLEVLFGLEPARSYLDLEPVIKELSINHIQNIVHKDEGTGLDILLGPAKPDMTDRISQELIVNTLRVCKNHYDFVVVDLPSGFNRISYTGLSESDEIFYLITPDSLSIRMFKHALKLLEQYQVLNKAQLRLVMNRKDKKSELTEKDIQKIVNQKVLGTIQSNYYAVQPYVNMGRTMFEKGKPKTKVASDVKRIVERLLR
ncbi:AAA family ATPase [Bacillus horti]|uniref:Pilus assembly protein CpaE n=1 Tax=Caldalkalibacillus horti TaxID=77523 RepID=A0ABT9VW42_9BACI|nr:AAA family ATPase [Bacillus horti]MDQ0165211.1 pilus assembly protein CpaE [Bacillus horti]